MSGAHVKGRLFARQNYWREIGARPFIFNIIQEGYKIPLLSDPPRAAFSNNQSALRNSEFVSSEIKELLRTNRIIEVSVPPWIVNPLTVSESKGKKRLILDLRHLNFYVCKETIKFDDWKVMMGFLEENGFAFKFDIKHGYHHVDIFGHHQKYLGFQWLDGGIQKYFCFTVLPFGLTSGPYIFTKIMRVLVKYWRSNLVKIAVFIDDGGAVSKDYRTATRASSFVQNSLKQSGFLENVEKCVWQPSQFITWLGVDIDLRNCILTITHDRILSTEALLHKIISCLPYTTARTLARLVGKLISKKLVYGNIVQLKTRNLYRAVELRLSWDGRIKLSLFPKAIIELFYWRDNLTYLNRKSFKEYDIPCLLAASDASEEGLGAHLTVHNKQFVSYRNLHTPEKQTGSTERELLAIEFALASFSPILQGNHVNWHTDNYAASLIIASGSSKEHLQLIAERVFDITVENAIHLKVKWIPREENVFADALSKSFDYDDWGVSDWLFLDVARRWGPFTVDRFADTFNTKTSRFNSKFMCPGTDQVDAFAVTWENENNYLVPPVSLVSKTIKHAVRCHAEGVLICPYWPSADFWPLLFHTKNVFKGFVTDHAIYSNRIAPCIVANNRKVILDGSVLALKIRC